MTSPRWPLVAVVSLLVLVMAAPARAEGWPKMRVFDQGDTVEVLITNVRLIATPALRVNRERIEVQLTGRPPELNLDPDDRLIKRIEIRTFDDRGVGPRWLSIKLRVDHDRVVALTAGAVAVQEDEGVRLRIPRKPLPPGEVAPAAAVTDGAQRGTAATMTAAAPAASDAASPPTAAPTTGEPATTGTAATAGTAAATPTSTTATTGAGAPTPTATTAAPAETPPTSGVGDRATGLAGTTAAEPAPARIAGGSGGPSVGRAVLAIIAIIVIAAGAMAFRRRRGLSPLAGPQLEVIATRHLGGKAKVVWLGAGDRELVLAVGPQQIRLLGQWRRGDAERSAPLALEAGEDEPAFAAGSSQVPRVRGRATAAVSGIMRLRGKVGPLADDVATGDVDADEQWARDILSATGGRR